MDWVAANRVLPAVASMSFGGGASTAFVDAINNMNGGMQMDILFSCGTNSVLAGVVCVVAAGNNAMDACQTYVQYSG